MKTNLDALLTALYVHLDDHVLRSADRPRRRGPDRVLNDAELDEPDAAHQATLLLGPLYHLPERRDRVTALREAARVTSPYSSGVNEGRITDVKLQERLMAGRANVPLLRQRVVLIAHLRRRSTAAG